MSRPRADATQTLQEVSASSDTAAARLFSLVYDELRDIAASYLRRERADHTLQPTALVHEAFVKLIDRSARTVENRAHFLGIAARAMRQVLVDHARGRQREKRGGGRARITLDEALTPSGSSLLEVLALDDALTRLSQKDPRLTQVVELRYFGGLTIAETAAALDVSHTTIENDWAMARAWLSRELSAGGEG